MMHGCAVPSSTLHPYAFAMAPHSITDPIGANAKPAMRKSTSPYQSHGNLLCGVAVIGILNQKSQFKVFASPNSLPTLLDDPVLLSPVPKRGEFRRRRLVR